MTRWHILYAIKKEPKNEKKPGKTLDKIDIVGYY